MDYYCFIKWDGSDEEGRIPNVPEDTPFILIAGEPDYCDWGLFECDLSDDYEFNEYIQPISEELDILLYSASSYPPAIAIAREDLEVSLRKMKNVSREDFSDMFQNILKQYLQLQKHSGHFLAEALEDDEDYMIKGAFYWIIGYDQVSDEVKWVSDDYYIYENPAKSFGLDSQRLRTVFSQ